MNESHKRHLAVTLGYIDQALREAMQILDTADSCSPFAKYTQDSSLQQRQIMARQIDTIEQRMAKIMCELDLPQPSPVCGALAAAFSQIGGARIALAEIRPKTMRGYGALSAEDILCVNTILAELDAALQRLTDEVSAAGLPPNG